MHRPDWPAVGPAEGVVQVAVVKTDDKLAAFDAVGHVLVKGTRPIGAYFANVAGPSLFIKAAIPCWQKDTVAVTGHEHTAFHSVDCRPRIATLCQQLHPLFIGRSAPALAPIDRGGVIAWQQCFQVVSEAVIAEIRVTTILS